MKTSLVLLPILACLPLLATAADDPIVTVRQGAPACATEALLEQLMDALIKNDQATGENLLKNGCIMLGRDVKGTIADFKGTGILVETTDTPQLGIWVPAKYIDQ